MRYPAVKSLWLFIVILCLLAAGLANSVYGDGEDAEGVGPSAVEFGSIVPVVTETGFISVSVDGLGTNSSSGGIIQVEKPAGATVRSAYVAAASTGFSRRVLADGDVKIDGVDVFWDVTTPSSISSFNSFADVTPIVQPKVDAAAPGRMDFDVTEISTQGIDGEVLVVIFDDPNQTTANTIVLLFGAQDISGDTFAIGLAEPLDLSDPKLALDLSLGISFGAQRCSIGQFSQVDVNGIRLSTSAGGEDDGVCQNGALLTVGGLDDSNDNPLDPFGTDTRDPRQDDELYDLIPFVSNGDIQIIVDTINPSNDDNIFFGALYLASTTAVVGEGILLAPLSDTNSLGTIHTVTATLQDDNGNPISDRNVDFEITSGPHAGLSGTATTDASGQAQFSYNGISIGTDGIEARFVDSKGTTQTATAQKTWVKERKVIFLLGINSQGYLDCNTKVAPSLHQFNNLKKSLTGIVEDDDFIWFSYNNGANNGYCDPGTYQMPRYDRINTCDGIDDNSAAAEELERLVSELVQDLPDVTIDIVAHSMGGVVATYWASQKDKGFLKKHIHSIVTLDSPLNGAEDTIIPSLGWVCILTDESVRDLRRFGSDVIDKIRDTFRTGDDKGTNILTSRVNLVHSNSTSFAGDLLPGYWRADHPQCRDVTNVLDISRVHHCMLNQDNQLGAVRRALRIDVYDNRSGNFTIVSGNQWDHNRSGGSTNGWIRGSAHITDDVASASIKMAGVEGSIIRALYTGNAAGKVQVDGGTEQTMPSHQRGCIDYPYGHDGRFTPRPALCEYTIFAAAGTHTVEITTIPECGFFPGCEFFFFDAIEAFPPFGLRLVVNSPVNILITDPDGRRVGFDPATGTVVNEIPGASYSGPSTEPQIVAIPTTLPGDYHMLITGIGSGDYTIEIETLSENDFVEAKRVLTGTTSAGLLETFDFDVRAEGTLILNPPVFNIPPTPVPGNEYTLNVGDTLAFNVQAADPDAGDMVAINTVVQPRAAILDCSIVGNPSECFFSWTPENTDVGVHTLTFTASDDDGDEAEHLTVFIEVVNRPPTADAGPDQTVAVTGPAGVAVSLDGTGSSDADNDPVTFSWSAPGITFDDPTSPAPTATFPVGTTNVTLVVNDGTVDSAPDTVEITVLDSSTCPDNVLLSNYQVDPSGNQFVEVTNVGSDPINVTGCSLVTFNVFTETSIGEATVDLSGLLDPGETTRVNFTDALPAGPGAIGIYDVTPAPADGTAFSTENEITGMVYLDNETVFGIGHLTEPAHNEIYECIYGGSGQGPFTRPFTPVADCLNGP